MRQGLLVALSLAGLFGAMAGKAEPAHALSVVQAWSRAVANPSSPGVVYLTITDSGETDRLTGVSSDVAASAQLHESRNDGGIMTMRPVDGIDVGPTAPIILGPGGYHIMLMGLKHPLKAGDSFTLTLTFAHAGPLSTTVTVLPPGGAP